MNSSSDLSDTIDKAFEETLQEIERNYEIEERNLFQRKLLNLFYYFIISHALINCHDFFLIELNDTIDFQRHYSFTPEDLQFFYSISDCDFPSTDLLFINMNSSDTVNSATAANNVSLYV